MVVGRVARYATALTAAVVLVVLPGGAVTAGSAALCAGRPATIVGTAGTDHIKGTPGPDVIAGLGGPDRIDGLGGDDVLCGGRGEDELTSYDDGRDVLVGGRGDDFAASFENPRARVRSGPGDDYLSGVIGFGGRWLLDGGPGHDSVYLNLTAALYDAGPLPGLIDLRTGRLRIASVAAGRFAGWEDLDLPGAVRWRAFGTDAAERFFFEGLVGIEVHTFGGDDEVLGTPHSDVIDTGAGDDTVTAYAGNDRCRHAEHTRGCEQVRSVVEPPRGPSGVSRPRLSP
jgi:Ca2+-binding RTX toxin-like protein